MLSSSCLSHCLMLFRDLYSHLFDHMWSHFRHRCQAIVGPLHTDFSFCHLFKFVRCPTVLNFYCLRFSCTFILDVHAVSISRCYFLVYGLSLIFRRPLSIPPRSPFPGFSISRMPLHLDTLVTFFLPLLGQASDFIIPLSHGIDFLPILRPVSEVLVTLVPLCRF